MFLKKPINKMSTWLLWSPIKFAIISMILMLGAVLLYTGFNPDGATQVGTFTAMSVGLILAIIFHIWRLPNDNLNRCEFVSINTAQMFLANLIFIIMTIGAVTYISAIDTNIIALPNMNPFIMAGLTLLGLVYMYLFGIFVGNIYTKYRRARTMGVPMWKIICTMPFGFSMLWIAGYMLPDAQTKAKSKTTKSTGRYAQIVNTICQNTIYAYIVLVLLVVTSGLFVGLRGMTTVLAMIIVFAAWRRTRGTTTMRRDITKQYSTTAIIINIIMIATGVLLAL